jgi:hypothetical protein
MGVVLEVKVIRPRKLRTDKVRLELLNALRAEGRDVKAELEKTVRNFQGARPGFETLIGLTTKEATVLTGPTGTIDAVQKWKWLDEGTRPHVISAKRAPLLKFRLGYNPGTTPGTLTTRGSYYVGSHWRSAKTVHHPGTKARGWSALVQEQHKKPFIKRMNEAVRTGMQKAYG